MKTVHNCDLCGSPEAIEVPYARLYTAGQPVHICQGCGFVYVRERRSAQEIADSWSHEIYGEGYTARIPAVLARQTYVADTLEVVAGLKGKLVCDIGAGEGQFLEIVRGQYGARVFGIEPSAANCASLRANGLDCFHGTIEQHLESGTEVAADIATIMWTLENCVSCRAMLDAAWRCLPVGGKLLVATGSRILVPFKKPLFDYLSTNPADTHSFRFSANTLQGLLAVSGFRPVFVNRYLDTDYLVVVGEKRPEGEAIGWCGDNPIVVHNFFERWHAETTHYLEPGTCTNNAEVR